MSGRPKESTFGLVTGIATIYNTLQVSKHRKEKKLSDSQIKDDLRNMHSEILEQSLINRFGIERMLEAQVANIQGMSLIGNVMTELLENYQNHIGYQLSKDTAQELFGDRKNLLLDIEEQYDELQQLCGTFPAQACLLLESLVDICKANGLNPENFKSADLKDLREIRGILKRVNQAPKAIRERSNWADEDYSNLKSAYDFIEKYPKKMNDLQQKVVDSENKLSSSKLKIRTLENKLVESKISFEDTQKWIDVEGDSEQNIATLETVLRTRVEEMKEIHTRLNQTYFFKKRRTFPEGERTFLKQDRLLDVQASQTTFFRTRRFLDEELKDAMKENAYVVAKLEYEEAERKKLELGQEMKRIKSDLKLAREHHAEVTKLNTKSRELNSDIIEIEKQLEAEYEILHQSESQLPKFLNEMQRLNSTLSEKQEVVTKFTPSSKLLD
tara:strand:+ start:263 stop:1588 length:1326 start_codon:yes stop_codon:yes gene_type:complete